MNKVINSIDDLDDLDLDLEDTNINKVDDEIDLEEASKEETTTIDDLELEDVTPEEPVKDDVVVEATKKDPLDEEIEFDLDVEVNEQKKSQSSVENKPEPTKSEAIEEHKKRGRKPKTETSEVVPTNKPVESEMLPKATPPEVKNNECYLDPQFDITKINADHYRFLVKPLNLSNYDKMIEDCIKINGEMVNPLQVVVEEGQFRLISGFNTFDILQKMMIGTAKVIVFQKMSTYEIVRRYITATHHLD